MPTKAIKTRGGWNLGRLERLPRVFSSIRCIPSWSASMAGVRAFAFRHRSVLAALPLVYAFFSTRWEYESNRVLWPLALSLCFAGAALRTWARWHNAYAQGRKKALAKTGPYEIVRNPLYIGNVLVIAGAGVASELAWFLPVIILWALLVYRAACAHEESRLLAKYGPAYEAYRAEVPGWLPRSLPSDSTRIKASGFWMVLTVQLLYACLLLVPFLVKELNPLRLWPHP